ncbi:amidohydrolase family protein [Deferrisoma sp.]
MSEVIIDFHAHVFEPDRASVVLADMGRRARIPHYYDGTVAGLERAMDEAGVDLAVVSRITTRAEQVDRVNRWLEGLRSPRIVPLATLHPDLPDPEAEVWRLRDAGFPGLKLHPDYQGFRVEEPRMFPVYRAAAEAGLFILYHAGLDRGLPGYPVHATPRGLREVHERFPELRVVAAHMGGEDVYEETTRVLLGTGVYLDTSFVLRKMPPEVLERFFERHGSRRIVFGTDYPWGHPAEDRRYLESLPYLTKTDRRRVLGGNARELLGIGS